MRSGIMMDDFLHIMGDEARYAGTLGGSEWSKWLADRTVTLNGLAPMTQARRHVFALDLGHHGGQRRESSRRAAAVPAPHHGRLRHHAEGLEHDTRTPLHTPRRRRRLPAAVDVAEKHRSSRPRCSR